MTKAKLFLTAFALFCFSVASSLPPGEYSSSIGFGGSTIKIVDSDSFEIVTGSCESTYFAYGNYKISNDTLILDYYKPPKDFKPLWSIDSVPSNDSSSLSITLNIVQENGVGIGNGNLSLTDSHNTGTISRFIGWSSPLMSRTHNISNWPTSPTYYEITYDVDYTFEPYLSSLYDYNIGLVLPNGYGYDYEEAVKYYEVKKLTPEHFDPMCTAGLMGRSYCLHPID